MSSQIASKGTQINNSKDQISPEHSTGKKKSSETQMQYNILYRQIIQKNLIMSLSFEIK